MSLTCTRCDGTGFLNAEQLPDDVEMLDDILLWIKQAVDDHDVVVCDCCGDGVDWYGTPGEHYNNDDPPGLTGPYASNGGLCRCN